MRCGFCLFEDEIFIPATQHWFARAVRGLVQVAVCHHCYTTIVFRGGWLRGPTIPVECGVGRNGSFEAVVVHPSFQKRPPRVSVTGSRRLPSRTISQNKVYVSRD